jgi:hypothetical protein
MLTVAEGISPGGCTLVEMLTIQQEPYVPLQNNSES